MLVRRDGLENSFNSFFQFPPTCLVKIKGKLKTATEYYSPLFHFYAIKKAPELASEAVFTY